MTVARNTDRWVLQLIAAALVVWFIAVLAAVLPGCAREGDPVDPTQAEAVLEAGQAPQVEPQAVTVTDGWVISYTPAEIAAEARNWRQVELVPGYTAVRRVHRGSVAVRAFHRASGDQSGFFVLAYPEIPTCWQDPGRPPATGAWRVTFGASGLNWPDADRTEISGTQWTLDNWRGDEVWIRWEHWEPGVGYTEASPWLVLRFQEADPEDPPDFREESPTY